MKINKTSLMAVLALGGMVAFGALAQAEDAPAKKPEHKRPGGPRGPGGPGGEMRGKMGEELGLSDDQKSKMEALQKELMPKMKALREDTTLSEEDKKAKFKALQEERMTKMKAILTAEQLEKLEKMKAHRPGGPGGPKGPKGPKGDKKPEAKSAE
jgi:Spy/CpxP family protein refolding chaperone